MSLTLPPSFGRASPRPKERRNPPPNGKENQGVARQPERVFRHFPPSDQFRAGGHPSCACGMSVIPCDLERSVSARREVNVRQVNSQTTHTSERCLTRRRQRERYSSLHACLQSCSD